MTAILLIAKQELKLSLRNRWVLSFLILFTVLTLGISYFGMITSGYVGFQDFRRTSASIINLSAYLIPLFALLIGVFSFISFREYLELLVTQPVTRTQILLGKYLGMFSAILVATLTGFGIPGLISAIRIGAVGAGRYMAVVLLSILLTASFLSIAILIVILMKRRLAAVGLAIGVWFFFVMFYDLIIMAMTLFFKKSVLHYLLIFGLLGNPVDIVRVMSLLSIGGTPLFGPAGASLIKMFENPVILSTVFSLALGLWIIVPFILALIIFKRQSLT
jgi:Cu-processing system permease protein